MPYSLTLAQLKWWVPHLICISTKGTFRFPFFVLFECCIPRVFFSLFLGGGVLCTYFPWNHYFSTSSDFLFVSFFCWGWGIFCRCRNLETMHMRAPYLLRYVVVSFILTRRKKFLDRICRVCFFVDSVLNFVVVVVDLWSEFPFLWHGLFLYFMIVDYSFVPLPFPRSNYRVVRKPVHRFWFRCSSGPTGASLQGRSFFLLLSCLCLCIFLYLGLSLCLVCERE